jgi:putative hydrolase of the HAD superfamily
MVQQHLLIDADDTLWENNIYFEQATHDFISFLNHSHLSEAEVQVVIDEAERLTVGYGSASFTRSLVTVYRQLAQKEVRDEDIQRVQQFGEGVRAHPIELLAGVQETLEYLFPRHPLFLLTKGYVEEQQFKVERSGIKDFFQQVIVVDEKNITTYQRLRAELELDATNSWMIGNSPRSDINPALAAGFNAVFVPHPHTWHLEHEEVEHNGSAQLLVLERFAQLHEHF